MFYEPLPGCITSNVRFSNSLEWKTWVRYTHAAIEPNRTNKKYSNWKKSNVQSDCFKKKLSDHVRMFYFRTSSIEIPRSSNEVELFTEKHEWNKIVHLIKRWNIQGDLKFCFFPTMEPVCNGPVLSGQFSKSRFFAHTNAVSLLLVLGGHLYWEAASSPTLSLSFLPVL